MLPFQFTDTADTLMRYVVELEKLAADEEGREGRPGAGAGRGRGAAASRRRRYEKAYAARRQGAPRRRCSATQGAAGSSTSCCCTSERKLGNSDGLPRRDWFKHQIYAPGFYTGYGVKTMPQIREGLEENRFDEAQGGVRTVSAAVNALAAQVQDAAQALQKASR